MASFFSSSSFTLTGRFIPVRLDWGQCRKVVILSGKYGPVCLTRRSREYLKEAFFRIKISRKSLILKCTAPCLNVVGITARDISGQLLGYMAVGLDSSYLVEAIQGSVTEVLRYELLDEPGIRVWVTSSICSSATASPCDDPHSYSTLFPNFKGKKTTPVTFWM